MDVYKYITNIEDKYNVNEIEYKNQKIWILFRNILTFRHLEKSFEKSTNLNNYKNYYFGFFRIFKKVDYLFILDHKNRRKYHEYYYDRIATGFLDELKLTQYSILTELKSNLSNKDLDSIIKNEEVISLKYINLFINIIHKFMPKQTLNGEDTLEKIYKENDIFLDYKNSFNKFLTAYYFYRILYKFKKVRILVTTCYHSNLYQIAAAKSLGIKVIELQHGTITHGYVPYTFKDNSDSIFKPDYLLSFGELTNIELGNYFIKRNNIISIGSWLLSKYKNDTNEPSFITDDKNKYKRIITVSGQDSYTFELTTFIEKLAKKYSDTIIYFVPRNTHVNFVNKNIRIITDYDIYKLIKFSDYHLTIFSTCSLEAIALGRKNIFYNYKNLSQEFYGRYIPSNSCNFYITKIIELDDIFNNDELCKEDNLSNKLFKEKNILNIKNFIKKLNI